MNLQKMTDEEIAAQLKNNSDPVLFSALIQRYETWVRRQCKQYLKDEETAKDVAQEVFIRLLTKIGSFRKCCQNAAGKNQNKSKLSAGKIQGCLAHPFIFY